MERKEPFNGITIDDGNETGLSQEPMKPVLIHLQLPLQSCVLRQASGKRRESGLP